MSQKGAIKAGFDGIELHGAHDSFYRISSPLFNQRNDRWGGDPKDVCDSRWPYYRK